MQRTSSKHVFDNINFKKLVFVCTSVLVSIIPIIGIDDVTLKISIYHLTKFIIS